jgi:hypothetical protein
MSTFSCLSEAVANGTLSQKSLDNYRERMNKAREEAKAKGMPTSEIEAFAESRAAMQMEADATSNRARVQRTILAIDTAREAAKKNSKGFGYGLTDVFGERIYGEGTGVSIGQQRYGNLQTISAIMDPFFSKIRSKAAGLKQNHILPKQVVSALFGKNVSDEAAKAAAEAWTAGMDWWRNQMERAGVKIAVLDDWRLPQHWDSATVSHFGEQKFVEKMSQWHEQGKLLLRDFENEGQLIAAGDQRATDIFRRAYENITTGGDSSIEPGVFKSKDMQQRYGRRRAFQWADDASWLEFNETFGVGDSGIGELMGRHAEKMARDLALVEVLGPDPDRAAKILIQMYRAENGNKLWADKLETIYGMQNGTLNNPVSQRLAMTGSTIRQWLSATQLSGALLSAPSDFGFTHAVASWYQLPMTQIMSGYFRDFVRAGGDRSQLFKDNMIVEVGTRGLHKIAEDVIGDIRRAPGIGSKTDVVLNGLAQATGKASEFVMRAQFLSHHTQVLRDNIGGVMMAKLGGEAHLPLAELDKGTQRLFRDYGITEANWNKLRTKAINKGFLDPSKLAREGDQAGIKMMGALALVQRAAVPEGNVVTRALMLGNNRPGTPTGELLRGFAQYRGFPMGAMLTHYYRALESLSDHEGQWFRGQYIASLIATTTVLGAASLQLKNLAAGKDPEPMNTKKFWLESASQGGALGILGNYIHAIFSAQRLDDASRSLSPTGGLALDTAELLLGQIHGAVEGQPKETFAKQGAKMFRKYTPSLWYERVAMDRLVHDTISRWADPDAAGAFQRMQDRARQQQNTQYWWRPGSTSPSRGPDFSRAVP